MKDQQAATRLFDYIKNYKNPDGWTSPLGNNLGRLVGEGVRDYQSIADAILKEQITDRDNEVMKVFREIIR